MVETSAVDVASNTFGEMEGPVVLTNPQAYIHKLPDELILHTFRYLKKGALAALSSTDRRCKRIADELLYQRVEDWNPSEKGKIQTLANNSKLAELVKEIGSMPLRRIAKKVKTDEESEAYTRMLQSATNIRWLKITCQNDSSDTYRGRQVQTLSWLQLFHRARLNITDQPPNPFVRLEQLHITGNGKLTIEDIMPVFRLPSLIRLRLSGLLEPFRIRNWNIPASSSAIEVLELDFAFISSAVVVQMLASIQALRSFRFDYTTDLWRPMGPEGDPRSYWAHTSWKDIGTALRRQKSSLEYIDYDESGVDELVMEQAYLEDGGRKTGILGSLKDFFRLKSFSGRIEMLLNLEDDEDDEDEDEVALILPVGLEHLSLHVTTFPGGARSDIYHQALMSLADGAYAGSLKSLVVEIFEGVPIGLLRLADTVEALQQLGTETRVYAMSGDIRQELQVNDLRE